MARTYPGRVSDETPQAGDLLVRIGAIVFLIGAVATLATVTPLFIGADPLPSVFYWVCMLMGVGFVVAAAGVLRSVAAQRRQARSSAA
ncbi:membrane protein [Streptomyces rimosus subsp. rimosus]|nr:membrane protein [Streptomyces sp. NRRL WC-3701]KOT32992.1 membrane protein [Streptomyces rimosus subsp. rimosus]KOT91562.1 membrane protein [Streptomyces rimosus subsp. pseudoverticillatus]KOT52062.1 membrane protein [Streptomyces rimosus subsp. rimosus]KOT52439.1 membrane protein [Streptomyces rimosus subsp. rimosus]